MSTHLNASAPFEQLFIRHGAASYDKQVYLQAMLGKAGWAFSLDEGTLAFRLPHETLQLSVQILGSESADDQTWLWGWANTDSAIPTTLLSVAEQLHTLGQTDAIPEFATAQFQLSETLNGSRIAAIATGISRAACYFRVAYPGGILYMLIKDARYKRSVRHPLARIARIFPLFSREIAVKDQRPAYLHYLAFYRLVAREDGDRIVAQGTHPIVDTVGGLNASDPLQIDPAQPQSLVATVDAVGHVSIALTASA